MASGVASVWVPVEDMDRARAFYRDTLGLREQKTTEDWSEFEANGLMIGLNARESAKRADGGAVLTFQPDGDLDAEVASLRDKGVEFTGGISDHPWGRIAPFKDSEGNDLQFYAPPA
ncbi:VOC family protein [Modestobacter lacusdianchii]